jgi:naphthalene 1,2-dioxygenase system ferredoxin subunit
MRTYFEGLSGCAMQPKRSKGKVKMQDTKSEIWYRAASTSEILDEDVLGVVVGPNGEHEVALYKIQGCYYATADRCTHQIARLSDGLVIDDCIECPLHQGRFHVPTGRAKSVPVSINLKTYPTKVEQGVVFVLI